MIGIINDKVKEVHQYLPYPLSAHVWFALIQSMEDGEDAVVLCGNLERSWWRAGLTKSKFFHSLSYLFSKQRNYGDSSQSKSKWNSSC